MSNPPPYGSPPPGGYQPPAPPTGKTQVLGLDYNIAALLSYLPICCINVIAPILWLATEPKENRFLRFHAFQSLFLLVLIVVIILPIYFISVVGGTVDPTGIMGIIALLLSLVMFAVSIGALVLVIVAMVKAYKYEMWKIPIVGNWAEKYA